MNNDMQMENTLAETNQFLLIECWSGQSNAVPEEHEQTWKM